MITVISATNRKDSNTFILSQSVYKLLTTISHENVQLFDFKKLNEADLSHEKMYSTEGQKSRIKELQDEYILPASHFIFVVPEYNGSYPGILKSFLDSISVRAATTSFFHKKALLIGLSTGRAGNLRGLDHLSDVLSYFKVIVYPTKIPVSRVSDLIVEKKLSHNQTMEVIEENMRHFLKM